MSIAIAGAGVGGLASGILLARAGHRVTVFDQFEAAGPVGSGLMLQETGLTILGALGLRTGAEALGSPIARLWGVSSETGRAVLDVRYGALRKSLVGIGIQRAALFDLLFDAAKAAGVRVVLGTRIVSADTAAGLFRD
ncbi:MAG TPA: FAD-dependent monooxygenase, partial [Hyphomonas sp.]|nr:FAD-dependent monooxygenase [Hyphomonas sp.]